MAIPAHFIHVLQDWKPTALLYAFGYILKRRGKSRENQRFSRRRIFDSPALGIIYIIGELMEEVSTGIDDLEIETIKLTKNGKFKDERRNR